MGVGPGGGELVASAWTGQVAARKAATISSGSRIGAVCAGQRQARGAMLIRRLAALLQIGVVVDVELGDRIDRDAERCRLGLDLPCDGALFRCPYSFALHVPAAVDRHEQPSAQVIGRQRRGSDAHLDQLIEVRFCGSDPGLLKTFRLGRANAPGRSLMA
jgi:hypothetical protein